MAQRRISRYKKNKNYLQRIVVYAVSAVILIITLINIFTPSADFSEDENRQLEKFPKASAASIADGSFSADFDSYYADQFFLRSSWVRLNFYAKYLIGQRCFSDVYIGKNGYLFSKPAEPDEEKNSATAAAINNFAGKHSDINTVFILVPDSASILKGLLPNGAVVRDQREDIRVFSEQLDRAVKVVDAGTVLSEHGDEYIYYKTDHHWTSLGAKYVFEATASQLGVNDDAQYTMLPVTDSFEGTLASRSGDHRSKDEISIYKYEDDIQYIVNVPDIGYTAASMYFSEKLDAKDKYTVFLGGNYPLVEVTTTASNGKNLLVFKDSYANCFLQFLIPYYGKIIMIDPRYYYDNVESVISNYQITDILYLYSADTLLADTVLKDTLGN